jgi:hypothetical protein
MLSLHLLQNSMVYLNMLMLRQVLAQPHWTGRLTATDFRALTPLIWEHVNPYGRFEPDMATRLPLAGQMNGQERLGWPGVSNQRETIVPSFAARGRIDQAVQYKRYQIDGRRH